MELLRELSGIWRGGCDAAGAAGGQRGKGGWGVLLVEASLVTICALLFEVSSAWASGVAVGFGRRFSLGFRV